MSTINFWPILVASIVSFGLGSLWYSPILFGREWMSLVKITEGDLDDARSRGVVKSYVIHFILTLLTFCVLGFIIAGTNTTNASDGAYAGFLIWLGFIMPMNVGGILWKKHQFKLALIESIFMLLSLVIGGAIIGAW